MARSHSRGFLYSEPPAPDEDRRTDETEADEPTVDETADPSPTPADD